MTSGVVYLAHRTAGEDSYEFIRQAEEMGLSTMYIGDTGWSTADPAEMGKTIQSEVNF